jgi:hypothetical protein
MRYLFTLLLLCFGAMIACSQDSLPYRHVPEAPDQFSGGAVAARIIDGLGFRFYWATEGLRESDLAYKPSNDARTCEETIAHIYEMSIIIANSATETANKRGQDKKLPFVEMRRQILENLKKASDRLRMASDLEMKNKKIIFERNNKVTEFPFWNQLNGPIADCLWHTGQLVSFRRASGNAMRSDVNFFSGTAPD